MFTGIVETIGEIIEIRQEMGNFHFLISSPISHELKVDQSLSHNGVCLTVTKIEALSHWVTAISETLSKTNLGLWQMGTMVNLERCLSVNGRFDGHIVQGHVDGTAKCTKVLEENGSWRYRFEYSSQLNQITVEKGSICVNGVSLTVVESGTNSFSVAIIPYTYNHTTFGLLKDGEVVNLEFDILGKYIQKIALMNQSK
jgi:riboflavin synthase